MESFADSLCCANLRFIMRDYSSYCLETDDKVGEGSQILMKTNCGVALFFETFVLKAREDKKNYKFLISSFSSRKL